MHPTPPSTPSDVGNTSDLGPLAWVFDELRKSLDSANKALKRFAVDVTDARESDLSAADPSSLRVARSQLHLVVGALEMVGFHAAASVVRGMEGAVQRFLAKPMLCNEVAVSKVERAGFGLIEYLEAVLNGKQISPVALFPQYRDVQELAAAQRIHPADLWEAPDRHPVFSLPDGVSVPALKPGADVRARFDRFVLHVIKNLHPIAATHMATTCAGLAAGVADSAQRTFWLAAAAYFEAVQHSLLPPDVYVKRAASRILLQYTAQSQSKPDVSSALLHDLCFFVALAREQDNPPTPWLNAVRRGLAAPSLAALDYERQTLGKYDPALLAQALRRVNAAKEGWSLLAGGDVDKTRQVSDQLSLVADSLHKILPAAEPLGRSLVHAVNVAGTGGNVPAPELGMEVATAILYLEALLQDIDAADVALPERMAQMAQRVDNAHAGMASQPLEPWMEVLYRKVSDKQTMGSVVGELKVSLAELERDLDQFSRDPANKTLLGPVPQKLAQMRGVLSVLGLDQAAAAVAHMRSNVETLLVDEIDPERAREAGTFSRLANNLSALSFLIDMLNYQPTLARKLFVFDAEQGELRPVMGRTAAGPVTAGVPASQPPLETQIEQAVQSVAEASQGSTSPADRADLSVRLDGLAEQAALADNAPLAQAAREASTAVAAMGTPSAQPIDAPALTGLAALAAPSASPVVESSEDDLVEDDLIDIFLEEARDVVQAGLAATKTLSRQPDSLGDKTTLRRAFHTLKGSSRMVGLTEFGDAAWAMEQVMNAWLAGSKPATPELCELCEDALQTLSQWVEDIAVHSADHWQAAPFVQASEAMRERGERMLLVPPAAAAPASLSIETSPTGDQIDVPDMGADQLAAPETGSPEPAAEVPDLMALFADELEPEAAMAPEAVSVDPLPVLDKESAADIAVTSADATWDVSAADTPLDMPVSPEDDMLAIDLDSMLALAEPTASPKASDAVGDAAHDADVGPAGDAEVLAAATTDAIPDFNLDWDVPLEDEVPPSDDVASTLEGGLALPEEEALPPVVDPLSVLDDASGSDWAGTPEPNTLPQPDVLELDLADFNFDFPDAAAPAVADLPPESGQADEVLPLADVHAVPPAVADRTADLDFDLDFGESPTGATVPVADDQFEPDTSEVGDAIAFDEPVAASETVFEIEPEPVAMGFDADDDTKVIGSLRIGVKLFNVYLNEADEWSRRLSHELGEWSLEHASQPVPDGTAALAHSLAGASAAVGFEPLSGLARALEHALDAAIAHAALNGQVATADEAALYVRAAEDIRRLLHQFAAGFLKEPAPDLVPALEALVHRPRAVEDPVPVSGVDDTADAVVLADDDDAFGVDTPLDAIVEVGEKVESAEPVDDQTGITLPDVVADSMVGAVDDASPEALPEWGIPPVATDMPTTVEAPAVRTDSPPAAVPKVASVDDDIDAVDTLDADLFQIFDEEAQELLPRLGAALRQWVARPENVSARVEVLRNLHTLKGSARLAGALRLGEMAHRMETQAERLGSAVADGALIEPLLASYDELVGRLDNLRLPDDVAVDHRVTTAAEVPADDLPVSMPPAPASVTGAQPVDGSLAAARLPTPVVHGTASAAVRVRPELLDRLVNQTGEVMITRSRMEAELGQLRGSLTDLTDNLDRLRHQLRDIELQAESQMQSRMAQTKDAHQAFDPLEFDRFTRVQELTRMMAESVNDVATVQRNLQRAVDATEDGLAAQARQTRELQRDLLRARAWLNSRALPTGCTAWCASLPKSRANRCGSTLLAAPSKWIVVCWTA
jgi:chemosensory pili system protein ChpA (sensor histidine kinase/response regulator)